MSGLKRFHEDLARLYAPKIILAVNFLHRDIKPGNILLARVGHCKLADFRLPKVGTFKGMWTEVVCGTDGYRAKRSIRAACVDLKRTGGLLDASCSV
jgi:serine/threonine protein kinase